jgi:hypothetical protein
LNGDGLFGLGQISDVVLNWDGIEGMVRDIGEEGSHGLVLVSSGGELKWMMMYGGREA